MLADTNGQVKKECLIFLVVTLVDHNVLAAFVATSSCENDEKEEEEQK